MRMRRSRVAEGECLQRELAAGQLWEFNELGLVGFRRGLEGDWAVGAVAGAAAVEEEEEGAMVTVEKRR